MLRDAIARQEFLITAEVAPPRGSDPASMLRQAAGLVGRVHAVNVTDSSRAVMGMSPLAAAVLLQQRLGLEAICQLACRDRNRIALQGDLLGAAALGLHNILSLTGDPVKAGDSPDAKAVFDLESVRLLRLIGQLNQGQDSNGKPLPEGGTHFLAGAAVDPQSHSWSGLQRRFEQKVLAGAQFFQSQLITDFEKLEQFMTQIASQCDKPVLAGIFLLKSAKNAQFINKYVPGVQIPESTIARLAQSPNPLDEGMAIAAEQIQTARHLCHGIHLMAVKAEHLMPQILDRAGIAPLDRSTATPILVPNTVHSSVLH